MSENEIKNTQPVPAMGDTQPNIPAKVTRKKFPGWLAALVIVLLIVIGALSGYGSGMGQRFDAQDTQQSGQLEEQFQLGKQALEAGNYELAREYFEFVLTTDQNFPGIQAAYADLLILMQVSPTPVFSPTPLVSPTPDLRGVEEIYNQAQQLLNVSDWDGAIANLDSLRKTDPSFRTAEVDGMYYMALHQRGVAKITGSCSTVNLEGGIYDLTLAEHFVGIGKLDSYAESLRTYARLYIIGASYWDQDWLQAQNFFAEVRTAYPNMQDSSCMSATRRYILATFKIAEQEYNFGNPCRAENAYENLFTTISDPFLATAYPLATAAVDKCNGGSGGGNANPPPDSNPQPTPTGSAATEPPVATCDPATPPCP